MRDEFACGSVQTEGSDAMRAKECTADNSPKINGLLIEPTTEMQSGTAGSVVFLKKSSGDDLSLTLPTGEMAYGDVTIGFSDITIGNINTVTDFRAFGVNDTGCFKSTGCPNPLQPYTLENHFELGHQYTSVPKPLTLSVVTSIAGFNGSWPLNDTAILTFSVHNIYALVDILAKLDLDFLFNLRFQQMFNLNCKPPQNS